MNAATGNACQAGIRKAAILVASLDRYAADLLLEQLGPECARLVREAVMALNEIDRQEQQRVIDEFRRIGPLLPGRCASGIELDGPLARQFASAGAREPADDGAAEGGTAWLSGSSRHSDFPPHSNGRAFEFLQEAEEEKLAQLLCSERPQTIALVLSHLPAERAGDVLARFAPALQVEVVRRLVERENSDPETLRDVERALEARLSQQFAIERQRASCAAAVSQILAACDRRVAGSILDNLAAYDRPLAEQLGRRQLQFDDLTQLDDAVLLAAFRAAEPELAQAVLLGAAPAFLGRLLRLMSPEEAENLRCRLDHPGPIRLSDVEEARQQIAALAQRLSSHTLRGTLLAA